MAVEYRVRIMDAEGEPIDIWIDRGENASSDTLQFQSADNMRVAMSLDRGTARDLAQVLHRFAEESEIAG